MRLYIYYVVFYSTQQMIVVLDLGSALSIFETVSLKNSAIYFIL